MNFTREPIIETIISAKEGYKLSIKSSKSPEAEEYLVDAVEVVSFGGTFFYRCQEKPKTFFIPAADFEIVEVKEARLLIKNPNIDKSIKIAGGKEASKPAKEEEVPSQEAKEGAQAVPQEPKRDNKKRGRRGRTKTAEVHPKPAQSTDASLSSTEPVRPTVFSHLLTPPPGLISDTLERYKQAAEEVPTTLTLEEENAKGNHKKHKGKEEEVHQEVQPEESDPYDAREYRTESLAEIMINDETQ